MIIETNSIGLGLRSYSFRKLRRGRWSRWETRWAGLMGYCGPRRLWSPETTFISRLARYINLLCRRFSRFARQCPREGPLFPKVHRSWMGATSFRSSWPLAVDFRSASLLPDAPDYISRLQERLAIWSKDYRRATQDFTKACYAWASMSTPIQTDFINIPLISCWHCVQHKFRPKMFARKLELTNIWSVLQKLMKAFAKSSSTLHERQWWKGRARLKGTRANTDAKSCNSMHGCYGVVR